MERDCHRAENLSLKHTIANTYMLSQVWQRTMPHYARLTHSPLWPTTALHSVKASAYVQQNGIHEHCMTWRALLRMYELEYFLQFVFLSPTVLTNHISCRVVSSAVEFAQLPCAQHGDVRGCSFLHN